MSVKTNTQRHEDDRIAVKISHLDELLALTGEVIINSSNIHTLHRNCQNLTESGKVINPNFTDMLKTASLAANRISSDLHTLVMDVRMVEIRDTFNSFRRLVREYSKKTGKNIQFSVTGEDTQVDKAMIESLIDPLNHLIRNASDHGIESPIERKAAGKKEDAKIHLNAYNKEGFTFIEVIDNGRGINIDKIKEKALALNLTDSENVDRLSNTEIFSFLFMPGFTTTEKATDISGRGVGMDVVKSNIESLGGIVDIETKVGFGTKVLMKIPELSAVNITDALTLRAKDDYYAIPINSVVATISLDQSEVNTALTSETIMYLGNIVTIYDLNELLYTKKSTKKDCDDLTGTISIIIIEAKNGRIGLKVSEFMSPQKLVILTLSNEYFNVLGISGMTIMAGNRLGMIIDPKELISLATDSKDEHKVINIFEHVAKRDDIDEKVLNEANEKEENRKKDIDESEIEEEELETTINLEERKEFFVEIENLFKKLDDSIFKLEKDPKNKDAVNTIFRDFHSIKGDLVMIGSLKNIVDFVHTVETILDAIRGDKLDITNDLVDILLDSVSVVRNAIEEVQKGVSPKIKDTELLDKLKSYEVTREKREMISKEDIQKKGFKLSATEEFTLLHKRLRGKNIYQSYIEFSSGFQENFLLAFLILKKLTEVGDIISSIPRIDELEERAGTSIKVLISSDYPIDKFDEFINSKLKDNYDIVEFQNYLE